MSTQNSKELIVRQGVGAFTLFKRRIFNWLGQIIYKLYQLHLYNNVTGYTFHGSELSEQMISEKHHSVNTGAIHIYKKEIQGANIETLSQYYPYLEIEKGNGFRDGLQWKICNVGCFYAGADAYFLKKNPGCSVVGLDFGDIGRINSDLDLPNLTLVSGYPLFTLRELDKQGDQRFDCTIFVRTAAVINIEQLLSYMECISSLSTEVIFLEAAKLSTSYKRSINIADIDMMNPVKLYGGYYLHNYISILEKYGYRISDCKVLPPAAFSHNLTSDHDFVYVRGNKQ
jgi:hypothetical protein